MTTTGPSGIFFSQISMLSATVYTELGNVLRMPRSTTASMVIELAFKAIPYEAMIQLFPGSETHQAPTGNVTTGLTRSMYALNDQIQMENVLVHGKGCCKLVLPDAALVGRSILSFAPTLTIWSKTADSGALETILTCFLVIMDEGGSLRTPPDHK